MLVDPHLDEGHQVVIVLEHDLLSIVEQKRMIHGERAQAFQVGADTVADLAGLDLGPGQFRVGGVTQTGDVFFAFDRAGEVRGDLRQPHLAAERGIDLVQVITKRCFRFQNDLFANGHLASFHQLVQLKALATGLLRYFVDGAEEGVDGFRLAQRMLLGRFQALLDLAAPLHCFFCISEVLVGL
ncbi:hypothetical protein PssB301D_02444 [Pseudomonas syringae pv. syringae str. B301D-R]|nr:hypothetical protein PssB301D_02444 [Pseudomonas syringae pv. syringae str. B301D-R]